MGRDRAKHTKQKRTAMHDKTFPTGRLPKRNVTQQEEEEKILPVTLKQRWPLAQQPGTSDRFRYFLDVTSSQGQSRLD